MSIFCLFLISGRPGAHLHGDLHYRDVHQDPGPGIHPPQEQLHEKPLEHHGLHRSRVRVSDGVSRVRPLCMIFTPIFRALSKAHGYVLRDWC